MKQNKKVVGTPEQSGKEENRPLNRKLERSITVDKRWSINKGKEKKKNGKCYLRGA